VGKRATLELPSGHSGRKHQVDALVAQSTTEAYFGRLRNSLAILRRGLEIARKANYNELAAQVWDASGNRRRLDIPMLKQAQAEHATLQ